LVPLHNVVKGYPITQKVFNNKGFYSVLSNKCNKSFCL